MKRQLEQLPVIQSRRGATLYEAAIALPILLILVVGLMEYGRAFMVGQLVTSAAREGARKVSFGSASNATITQTVKDWLLEFGHIERDDVQVTLTVTPYAGTPQSADQDIAQCNRHDLVTVKVEVPFRKISILPPICLRNTMLAAESAATYE